MLATEKFVSSAYDTAIFECTNSNIRQILNHIQKEEQQHGEQIFNYMHSLSLIHIFPRIWVLLISKITQPRNLQVIKTSKIIQLLSNNLARH